MSRATFQLAAVVFATIVLIVSGLPTVSQENTRAQPAVVLLGEARASAEHPLIALDSSNGEAGEPEDRVDPKNMFSARKLATMALALHWYHDAHGAFPAGYSADPTGRPLLSWRVHILPHLGERELYEQFDLDEPWDSLQNRSLINKMPDIYRSPRSRDKTGRSNYLGNSGADGVFLRPLNGGKDGNGIRHVRDGTSNTVMVVEVPDDWAIVWTRPGDLAPKERLQGLLDQPHGFQVVMADGRVHFLPPSMKKKPLQAMFSKAGREPVDFPGDVLLTTGDVMDSLGPKR